MASTLSILTSILLFSTWSLHHPSLFLSPPPLISNWHSRAVHSYFPTQTWKSLESSVYPIDPESQWCILFPTVALLRWTLREPPSVETKSQSHLVAQPSIRSALQALGSFLAFQRPCPLTESFLEALARYVARPTPAHVKLSSIHPTTTSRLTSIPYSHALPETS